MFTTPHAHIKRFVALAKLVMFLVFIIHDYFMQTTQHELTTCYVVDGLPHLKWYMIHSV